MKQKNYVEKDWVWSGLNTGMSWSDLDCSTGINQPWAGLLNLSGLNCSSGSDQTVAMWNGVPWTVALQYWNGGIINRDFVGFLDSTKNFFLDNNIGFIFNHYLDRGVVGTLLLTRTTTVQLKLQYNSGLHISPYHIPLQSKILNEAKILSRPQFSSKHNCFQITLSVQTTRPQFGE